MIASNLSYVRRLDGFCDAIAVVVLVAIVLAVV